MIDEALFDAEEKMEKAVSVARDDLSTIRTGRANPGMFSSPVERAVLARRVRVHPILTGPTIDHTPHSVADPVPPRRPVKGAHTQ